MQELFRAESRAEAAWWCPCRSIGPPETVVHRAESTSVLDRIPAGTRRGDRTMKVKFDIAILGTQPVPVIVRQAQLAERLGYDAAWITDTHLVCRELWVTLAACAVATSTITLGPGVAVPHSRHVSVTA